MAAIPPAPEQSPLDRDLAILEMKLSETTDIANDLCERLRPHLPLSYFDGDCRGEDDEYDTSLSPTQIRVRKITDRLHRLSSDIRSMKDNVVG